jgi:hypothetical protein
LPRIITSYQRSRFRPRPLSAGDHQHVGAHVGEQHAGEGRRADRLELEDTNAGKRARHATSSGG